jgi:ATP adenylyltransferase
MTPADLRARVEARTQHALATGALHPIETESRTVRDRGVDFVVRSISSLARKAAARVREADDAKDNAKQPEPSRNPFLPYDPDLFVCDVSPTHVCLLNKYNVIEHHLLIVTRTFVDQETILNLDDFRALSWCLEGIGGLGFYNGGRDAGASQPHKHLQVVPHGLAPGRGTAPPIEAVLRASLAEPAVIARCPALPFRHALVRLPAVQGDAAECLETVYRCLIEAAGMSIRGTAEDARPSGPYNLLVTREWMLLIPRRRECVDGISVNALGFAGSLFVRSPEQMRRVVTRGPMAILAAVSGTPPAPS